MTMTDPKTDRTRTQVNSALGQVRTSMLAALGAGNLASQAVADAVNKTRERVTEGSEAARRNIEELPSDVESLRGRLDPAELRKAVDEYTDAALKLYNKLAESGEEAWDKLAAQPQVKRALEQLEEAVAAAQDRAGGVATDTRGRVDEVLGLITKRTRSTGEKSARRVKEAAGDVAEKVEEAGDDVASETRSVSRKAANKTAPRTAATSRRTTSSTSSTSGTSGSSNNSGPAKKSTGTTSKNTK
jgi:heparin binding hemagglutinin HbhA